MIDLRRTLEDAVKNPERIAEINRLDAQQRSQFRDVLGATQMILESVRNRIISEFEESGA
jgi:hypothetical protein